MITQTEQIFFFFLKQIETYDEGGGPRDVKANDELKESDNDQQQQQQRQKRVHLGESKFTFLCNVVSVYCFKFVRII